jgi:hypothetical protein
MRGSFTLSATTSCGTEKRFLAYSTSGSFEQANGL